MRVVRLQATGIRWLAAALATAAVCLGVAGSATAASVLGGTQLAGGGKDWKLLVGMNLPLEVSGSTVKGQLTVNLPNRQWRQKWQGRVHAGSLRLGDQRSFFRFVQGIRIPVNLGRAIARQGSRASLRSAISYPLPEADPTADRAAGHAVQQKKIKRAKPGFCETLPRVLFRSGGATSKSIRFPVCGRPVKWKLTDLATKGKVTLRTGGLGYTKNAGRTGADDFELSGYRNGHLVTRQRVHIRLADGKSTSVIAFGDSVTAGFGYYGATGKAMTIGQLLGCKPGATTLNDACSSNSYNRKSSVGSKPNYLPDFGLSRNISWPAQWANEYGITDYANYAVTGSAPTDWLPGGQFHSTLEQIQSQNPDYILMTLGANPLLSDVLFNIDTMGCALESDLFGDFEQCVLDAFATVNLSSNMNQVFTELVGNTTSRIVLMAYPLTIPSSALAYSTAQLEMMESLLNQVIAGQAAAVSTSRITIVKPPRFNVGIDLEPLYPSNYSCSMLGYKVDGPSVQSTPTQDELEVYHPLSFCSGPAFGQPWVISGDTGIHPSSSGYFQMASQIPAPGS